MHKEAQVTLETALEHGLTEEEYGKVLEILGRTPTWTELGIFSVMWSEHCSYKNSIAVVKTLPRSGGRLVVGAGEENAGLIDAGDGFYVAFKIESHNHPSAVEPYQGAATGVGGILRDVFSMGARPVASLNSLRFGPLDKPRNRWLLREVVKGIGDYGNCMGVPTVGGEIYFEEAYSGNPLVNAMTIGVLKNKKFISATSRGEGNPVYIIGSSTGRDGIHGATFASEELSEKSEERKSNVQVGDPFTEKTLMEATLELLGKAWLIGIQDMGAAGITCCSTEMSDRGKHGMDLHLDRVHLREKGMSPYEIMLSESQERMMVVVRKGFEEDAEKVFNKWEIDYSLAGVVTGEKENVRIFENGELKADVPPFDLVLGGGAPVYYRETRRPAYLDETAAFDIESIPDLDNADEAFMKLMASPNIASKKWIFQQYDHSVRANTVIAPGGDAAVVRLKGSTKAIASSTDGNGRYVYLNPWKGGAIAVMESARNVACTGAEPVAVTNCLNFGNPYDPEVYYQFKEAVRGMGEACSALQTPVTGGNVSFYNESPDSEVYPTPVIGMVGIIEDVSRTMTPWFKDEGDFICLLGTLKGELGGSEYLRHIHGIVSGDAPQVDLDFANRLNRALVEAIRQNLVKSAHDISDGGLAVALAESAVGGPSVLGVDIYSMRKLRNDAFIFGETQSVVVVSVDEKQLLDIERVAGEYAVPCTTIGRVRGGSRLKINDILDVDLNEVKKIYETRIETLMEGLEA